MVLPTGGGKTALIAELVRLNRSFGRRSTVICHPREIVLQIAGAIAPDQNHERLEGDVHNIVRPPSGSGC